MFFPAQLLTGMLRSVHKVFLEKPKLNVDFCSLGCVLERKWVSRLWWVWDVVWGNSYYMLWIKLTGVVGLFSLLCFWAETPQRNFEYQGGAFEFYVYF
jgi:hypothetical protein